MDMSMYPPSWYTQYGNFATSGWSPTVLNKEQEATFQKDLRESDWLNEIYKSVSKKNPSATKEGLLQEMLAYGDYDYRGAWLDNATTSADKHDGGTLHWPTKSTKGNMLKSPTHDTAWKEFFMQQYNADPSELGLNNIQDALQWSQSNAYGLRPDGTQKNTGFFGPIPSMDGTDMTEYSVTLNIGGKDVLMPAIVPTLLPTQLADIVNTGNISNDAYNRIAQHAMQRQAQGLDPFFMPGVDKQMPYQQYIPQGLLHHVK